MQICANLNHRKKVEKTGSKPGRCNCFFQTITPLQIFCHLIG